MLFTFERTLPKSLRTVSSFPAHPFKKRGCSAPSLLPPIAPAQAVELVITTLIDFQPGIFQILLALSSFLVRHIFKKQCLQLSKSLVVPSGCKISIDFGALSTGVLCLWS